MQQIDGSESAPGRRIRRVAAAVGVAAVVLLAVPAAGLAADGWPQYGFNARHTFANPAERGITPQTVADLRPGWARTIAPGRRLIAASLAERLRPTPEMMITSRARSFRRSCGRA